MKSKLLLAGMVTVMGLSANAQEKMMSEAEKQLALKSTGFYCQNKSKRITRIERSRKRC